MEYEKYMILTVSRSLQACKPRIQALRKDGSYDDWVSDGSGGNQKDRFLLLQRRDRMLCDLPPFADQLTPDFINLFQLPSRTDHRARTVTRPELSLSSCGEAAFAVIWKRSGTGGKNCSLDLRKILRRTEEDELVAYNA
jgi:hypothetical protein